MALGKRIRERRKEFQLTQEELGQLIGVGQSTIATLERLDYEKSKYDLDLARVLGVTPEWLRSGTPPKFPPDAFNLGETAPPAYKTDKRTDLLIRQRLLIEKVFKLSHRALDRIEPLVEDMSRLDFIEKQKKDA